MHKTSLEILRHLASCNMPVSVEYLTNQFGINAEKYIQELVDIEYVCEENARVYARSAASSPFIHSTPSGLYRITGAGRAYIECRIRNGFERWATLVIAAIGAITGIIALLK